VKGFAADYDCFEDIDDPNQTQINIFTGRGVLIESQGPAWFYASASEHSLVYQYNLAGAQDIFMGMVSHYFAVATSIVIFVHFEYQIDLHCTDSNGKPLLFAAPDFSFHIQRNFLRL
jgi:hypothetical protein